MKIRFQAKNLILLNCLLATAFTGPVIAGTPISKESFHYLGAFRVPKVSFDGKSVQNNPSVNAQYQPLAFNPSNNSLFIGQRTGAIGAPKGIAEISIPEVIKPATVSYDITRLNESIFIQPPTDVSQGAFDKLQQGGGIPPVEARGFLGGLFVFEGKLLGTTWAYYDASASHGFRSHWRSNLDWTDNNYGFDGLHAVGQSPVGSIANGGFVGGYIAEIPDEYKEILGYKLLTGRTGGPISWRSSFGPTLWGFAHDKLNYDQPADAKMFLGYTGDHRTISAPDINTPSLTHNMSTGIRGVIWPKNSSSILFFGGHGFGISYDSEGVPLNNPTPRCVGAGTSSRSEVKSNDWLVRNTPTKWMCGYTKLSADEISNGNSCCFDPLNPAVGEHITPYIIGHGQACYGFGTTDHTEARMNKWLVANSPNGYSCGESTMSKGSIAGGGTCCFVGTGSTAKGGASFPSVHQVWQYEVEDLILVKNGVKQPWDILPKVWNIDLPFDNPNKIKQIFGTAYDAINNRVYVGQAFGEGNYPVIHVFEILYPPMPINGFDIK